MSAAPLAMAARMTPAFRVSTEIAAGRSASRSSTGPMRRSSSASLTGLRAGPGGFAADIDEFGALRDEPPCMGGGGFRLAEIAAIGEAVRRDIDDPHDPRSVEATRRRWSASAR